MLLYDVPKICINEIVKRDGRRVPFNRDKIVQAVKKAFVSVGEMRNEEYCQKVADEVAEEVYYRYNYAPTVEQIQDLVEEALIKNNHARVAKAYILYRAERSRAREMKTNLMKIYEDITFSDSKSSDIKRENANVNGDTAMGTMLKYGSEGAKQFYNMFVLDPEHARAHTEGDIHIHDLDFLTMTTTCCQIDLVTLFAGGFGTGHGFLREPKDIASYSALACIAIQSNQNDQHGGQSVPNFDYALALGVKKTFEKKYVQNMSRLLEGFSNDDDMDFDAFCGEVQDILAKKELHVTLNNNEEYLREELAILVDRGIALETAEKIQKKSLKNAAKETDRATFQAMEALIHNLNTMHSRAGAQTPFSSINYGLDTSDEGRMVIKNVLLALDAGLGHGETAIFPIHIFRVKEGISFNPGDKNYDLFQLACRVSAKRLFPNFAFVDAPFNLQYYEEGKPETEVAYMGCRTRVIGNVYDETREVTFGRGNLSYTSINLPRIAIKCHGDIGRFMRELDKKISLCIDQLLARFRIQAGKKVKNYPFLMGQGIWIDSNTLSNEDTVGEILKHGTLSVGFIGLAECLTALTGHHHGETANSQKLGLEIIGAMRSRLDEESKKQKLNFTLIATPGEGLSGRFVKIDAKMYGKIDGVTDREYYTNSFHIPVYFPISAADKIRLEAPYHALTNAGHITYVELDGDLVRNTAAFEKIIRYMKECGIGYGSINHPVDRDPVCGYTGVIYDVCPSCNRHEFEGHEKLGFERIRRITGYLAGTIDRFNDAKQAETRDRLKHSMQTLTPSITE